MTDPTIEDFELLADCLIVGTKYDPRTDPDFAERREDFGEETLPHYLHDPEEGAA